VRLFASKRLPSRDVVVIIACRFDEILGGLLNFNRNTFIFQWLFSSVVVGGKPKTANTYTMALASYVVKRLLKHSEMLQASS
jgi:hypothetical protein